MERIVNQQYAELIAFAISAVPPKIMEIIRPVHFFTGTDPHYAGLNISDEKTEDGRLYKETMHFIPEECQLHLPKSYRCPTIVMPIFPETPGDVVHELGHALDDKTMWYQYVTDITPVTEYAKTCHEEAFAEAFASWLFYGYDREPDEETLALFERLVHGN
jgi:cobalamin biosynthesis Mg chelatase CobN